MVGTDTTERGEESSCRILFRDSQNKLAAICSGTLIGPNRISTAGHCVSEVASNHWVATVACGYQGNMEKQVEEFTNGGSHVLVGGPKFKETRLGKKFFIDKNYDHNTNGIDVGEIEIDPPITNIKPVLKANSKTALLGIFKNEIRKNGQIKLSILPAAQCRTEGYGINGSGTSGVLSSAPTSGPFITDSSYKNLEFSADLDLSNLRSQDQMNSFSNCEVENQIDGTPKTMVPLAMLLHKMRMVKALFLNGDSGGPLYCRKNGESPWLLFGTAATTQFKSPKRVTNAWAITVAAELVPVPGTTLPAQ